ncbi:MAG TPA: PEP-CTERM sorting domain-containing protein, partial [Chthoniobacterales bacterium]|nr:PEP-CTERM sorting domain-containing protein [Chthoniobacterales bacterium]
HMRLTVKSSFFAVATFVVCAVGPAYAGKVQGFETGEPAVVSTGDAGKVGTFQGQAAPEGSMQFLLTTIGSMSNEDSLTSQSGVFAVANSALQTFFGIGLTGNQGSGVLIPFTVAAGDTFLTLQYDFLTNELFQSTPRDDFAFGAIFNASNVLQGAVNDFASVNAPPATFGLFGAQTPFQFHTGLQTLSFSLASLAPGNYTLGIGIEDRLTADHASGLLIDNVQVVPEPSVFALVAAGAGLMLGLRRRLKRS